MSAIFRKKPNRLRRATNSVKTSSGSHHIRSPILPPIENTAEQSSSGLSETDIRCLPTKKNAIWDAFRTVQRSQGVSHFKFMQKRKTRQLPDMEILLQELDKSINSDDHLPQRKVAFQPQLTE